MFVDSGAIVNLMPYSLYKKHGGMDDELIKVNMMINGVGGGEPIPTKGFALMDLTVRSKTLAMAFFIAEVQCSYNLIHGHDWIHANQCVHSILHQYIIKLVGDDIEIVHVDSSACVATIDAPSPRRNDGIGFLSSHDHDDF